ncbi:unnamed protein product [Microthlaspi erraticum]|uniref:F-box associated beta-propeller type 3 domain-containing protein n=1 Tax=Microthlaspi erraticum TaxID=1685480 RepID=A0A6D2KEZ2_9BRAS|nr:unnamed protein product [Microthlaspi erraticum]
MMTTQRSKRRRSCSNSRNKGAKFEEIPFDLVTEILLRLPEKSVSRFRCVSTIRSPNFNESFFAISSSRPKLLFAYISDDSTFFFSSPQPQTSSSLTARLHTSFPVECDLSDNLCGQWTFGPTQGTVQTVCNLSTGQILTLPEVKSAAYIIKCSLGFDPTEQKIKVFCTAQPNESLGPEDLMYQVLTLGTGKQMSWRKMTCDVPGFGSAFRKVGICINGVLYYLPVPFGTGSTSTSMYHGSHQVPDIFFFDLRYEKLGYIKKAQDMKVVDSPYRLFGHESSALANYKGKLAKLELWNEVIGTSIHMWVLQDAEKHQWSSYAYGMPPPWKSITGHNLHFVGITNNGEIVMSPDRPFFRDEIYYDSFYLIYYNPERNTVTRVDIKEMEGHWKSNAYVFLDYVENVKLMPNI